MLLLDSISLYDAFSLYIVKFPNSNINAVILQHSIQYRMHCSKMVAIITYTGKFLHYRKCEKLESTSYFYQKNVTNSQIDNLVWRVLNMS